ncbi:MAG: dihydroorotase [Coleofasciculaceae cyanobacterium RL_1_1]|nr:dihydroorotase [Coleofasciculaceae cyanobacterium RL_1_1]
MTSELLQQVRAIDPSSETDQVVDVWIENGVIRAIETAISESSEDLPAETTVRDRQGCILAPGLVDLYSHSGEPGRESNETLASLQAAAAAGGFTRVAILPDTHPVIDRPEIVARITHRTPFHYPQLLAWGALTLGTRGEQLTEMAELVTAGIVGFSDGTAIEDLLLLRRQLEYAQPFGQPIAIWPYSKRLANRGTAREGSDSLRFGLPGDPAMSETALIAAAIECIADLGRNDSSITAHFMRVSTARGVELIDRAKQRGLNITASTPWTHLLLSTRNLGSYDPNLHLSPPLGPPADRDALAAAVASGTIDAIAIDHTPIAYEDKTVPFSESPPGAIGLELALSLLWQEFVESGQWSPLVLWRSLSLNPARCLQIDPPRLEVGAPAELVLFDPVRTWTPGSHSLQSKSSNTSWIDRQMSGRVLQIYYPLD